ncbi:MAG: hypothetical protein AAFP19_22590 [Bacteroidota bacterium]
MANSQKNKWTNIFLVAVFIPSLIIVFWVTRGMIEHVYGPDREEYLIPDLYIGKLLILFNQKDGSEKEYKGFKRRIYRFSKNGFLKTQFDINEGLFKKGYKRFYYVNHQGKKLKRLPSVSLGRLIERHYDPNLPKNISRFFPDSVYVATSSHIQYHPRDVVEEERLNSSMEGHFNYVIIDTLKNLLKFQRPPDSIHFRKYKFN